MHKKGFTLIELLIVVVIVALILLVAVPSFRTNRIAGDNRAATSMLIQLGTGARNYTIERRGGIPRPLGDAMRNITATDLTALASCPASTAVTSDPVTNVRNMFACNYARPFENTETNTRAIYRGYVFTACPDNPAAGDTSCCSANGTTPRKVITMNFNAAGTPNINAANTANRFTNAAACAWVDVEGNVGNNYNLNAPI